MPQFSSISGSAASKALRDAGVDHVVTVPDWVQLSLHSHLSRDNLNIRLLNTCNENQAVTVASGLYIAGKKPVLVMQNQGFYNCINTVRAVCLDAHIPLVFMVGQFGREFSNIGFDSRESKRTMVSLMEPLLDTLGASYIRLDNNEDLTKIPEAFELAEEKGGAVVLLVGAPMNWG